MFSNIAKKLEVFVIVSIIALIGIIYALTKQPVVAPTIRDNQNQESQNVQQVPQTTVRYQGVEGKTALELLKASHNVETKEFSGIGEYVVSIDGVQPEPNKAFWAFYVNDKQAEVGAGSYVTKSSDVIEWKLEEIR